MMCDYMKIGVLGAVFPTKYSYVNVPDLNRLFHVMMSQNETKKKPLRLQFMISRKSQFNPMKKTEMNSCQ